jgi:GT2 family glycosyltransferase
MTVPPRPLCVVPAYLRTSEDLDVLVRCLVSLWGTAGAPDAVVVDDGSPARELVEMLGAACAELGFELVAKDANEGFARTVNVGLRRALEQGRDAVLVNADLEFTQAGWLEAMLARTDTQGRPAAVVGAKLVFPNGCIQHAGVYFSAADHRWWHRCAYAPGDLPEAQTPLLCPVTGALQLIRHETLATVGLYDEGFRLGLEDVDYCLRVFDAGLECIYEPAARAVHAESVFRGRTTRKIDAWHEASTRHLWTKYAHADFSPWVPAV